MEKRSKHKGKGAQKKRPRRSLTVVSAPTGAPTVVEVERMVPGGFGLVRDEEGITLVRGGLPGEKVELGPLRKRGGARFGDVVKVVEASPHRRAPDCDAHPLCGGCDFLDFDSGAAQEARLEMVHDALVRIGRLDESALERVVSTSSAPLSAGSRRRCRVQIDKHGLPGFARRGDARILSRSRCAALAPRLEAALGALHDEGGWPPGARIRLAVDDRDHVSACVEGTSETKGREVARRLVDSGIAHGALVVDEEGAVEHIVGDAVLEGEVAPGVRGGPYRSDAATFSQATRFGSTEIIRAVLEGARALAVGPGAVVLELFAGAGQLTLPLAELGAQVIAVEGAPRSIEWLRKNANQAGYDEEIRAVWSHIDGDRFPVAIDAFLRKPRPDLLVVDPPRTGIVDFEGILEYQPAPALILVSCDLATGARDLQLAARHGYQLGRLTVIDAFPRTSHVEWVAVLVRDPRLEEEFEDGSDDEDYDDDDGDDGAVD